MLITERSPPLPASRDNIKLRAHALAKLLVGCTAMSGLLFTASAQAFPIGQWAYAEQGGYLYTRTDIQSRKTGRIHWLTEDGFLEVYRIISVKRKAKNGREWIRVLMPARPNGRAGWVLRDRLGRIHHATKQLHLNRHYHRAVLWSKNKRSSWHRIWSAPIAVGKQSTPTPGGTFWIREKIRSLRSSNIYGPWAFGTSAYSVLSDWPGGGVVGLHGTNQPWLIGRSVSHGCIRIRNHDIAKLARHLEVGTPLIIR